MVGQQVVVDLFLSLIAPQPGVQPLQLILGPSEIGAIVRIDVLRAIPSRDESPKTGKEGCCSLLSDYLKMDCLIYKADEYADVSR